MRVLAFGAHPDDIEYHVAGTLMKMKKRGDEIFMCIATNGNIGSYTHTKEEIAAIRYEEAKASADHIGATLIWLDEPDEFLFDNESTRLKFIEVVRMVRPDVIFTHPAGMRDYNQDHDMTGYLAFQARVLATVKAIETEHDVIDHIPPLFYYQPDGMAHTFRPQYFVDITEEFDDRMKMFKCHESQHGDWCDDAFGISYCNILESDAKYYASVCGTPKVQYAEAFELCDRWPIIAGAHKLLP